MLKRLLCMLLTGLVLWTSIPLEAEATVKDYTIVATEEDGSKVKLKDGDIFAGNSKVKLNGATNFYLVKDFEFKTPKFYTVPKHASVIEKIKGADGKEIQLISFVRTGTVYVKCKYKGKVYSKCQTADYRGLISVQLWLD
ncbi:MAG: hypothetical protein ACOCNB_06935 [Acetivibrio ethanolgignens]